MNQIIKHLKKAVLLLAFFLIAPLYALAANKLELPELLHLFAQQKQSTVDFTEEKHAFFLDKAIMSSGHLQYSAPNKLYKVIEKPERISQKVIGDILEIKNTKQTKTIDLNDHPEFSVLLRSIISLLSGNHAALKKDFEITYEYKPSIWTLTLVPHDSYILSYIESIKMFGKKNNLSKIIVTEPNNDHSITHLSNHR